MSLLLAFVMMGSAGPRGVVTNPVANMYSAPTEESDVVSQAIYGTNVVMTGEKQGWLRVRTADDYAGWMPLASLRLLVPSEAAYASTGRVAQVESLFANLYREPDVTKHPPLLTVPFETRLEVVSEQGSEEGRCWLEVRLPDGPSAWVQRGDITFDAKRLSIAQTIALSQRFLGLPYMWGGTSSFGYDCSGFVQMLVRRRGVIMPRDADLQASWTGALPVKPKKLKPGDLLFFGESAEKVTHTGMYMGRGKFVHATTQGHPVIQISKLSDQPWRKLLLACRRIK